MTDDDRDLERQLRGWLQSAAPIPPPGMAERLLRQTTAAPQRRGWMPWPRMLPALGVAALVAVAIVIGLQAGRVLPGLTPPVGDQPSPTAVPTSSAPTSPTEVATPSAEPSPAGNICRNPADGYAVDYPAAWYTNEAIPASDEFDAVPACRYFASRPFEIRPNAGVPPAVAITFQLAPEATPVDGTLVSRGRTVVAGRPATVREFAIESEGFMPPGTRVYEYLIELPGGEVLLVSTDSSREGDYAQHRQVLDVMMQTLEFTR
ncbi:MAG TPA: hypothetical protein VHK63_02985 [Candidatus Limnocylindria bacterium]|nr:hypothetical protein [Candidatus Limnocylindria bacterium]